MTNFSGIGRKGIWAWLTPERAVLVLPIVAGLGLSLPLLSVGITPLMLRVREQSEIVEQLTAKAEFLPVLRQQLAELKQQQKRTDFQLERLLNLVAGTSQLNTFLAELNDLALFHEVAITTTKPGPVERFTAPIPAQGNGQEAPPAAGGGDSAAEPGDPLLNRGLEKRSAALTVTGPFEQVLAFLQSLERLEVFVVVSQMNVREQIRQIQGGLSLPEVAMDLTLTAYGRQIAMAED